MLGSISLIFCILANSGIWTIPYKTHCYTNLVFTNLYNILFSLYIILITQKPGTQQIDKTHVNISVDVGGKNEYCEK